MPPEQMSKFLPDNLQTYWDDPPEWTPDGLKLEKAKKRGERHILEIRGKQLDNVLETLNLDD